MNFEPASKPSPLPPAPFSSVAEMVPEMVQRSAGRGTRVRRVFCGLLLPACLLAPRAGVPQQPPQNPGLGCVATLENRSTLVDANGFYVLPNIPSSLQFPALYRVQVVCPQPDGTVLSAQSDPLSIATSPFTIPLLTLGPMAPQPSSILINVSSGTLSAVGAQVMLQTTAFLPDGTPQDVSGPTQGTTYGSSNTTVASVDANGVVTAVGPGAVTITARNNGLTSTVLLSSFGLLDSDGDGIPDAYEIANGLNPYDPTDAALDPDGDGLTNLQEYQLGTNPHVADTDGDGLNDGAEVALGTNPLVADTDGDGLSDGDEVRLGTNPLVADTDGDGIPDGVEVKIGTNPLVADVTTTVTGYVTNGNGQPVANASVVVFTYFSASTNASGAYSLLHVPVTLGAITATAEAAIANQIYKGTSASLTPVPNGNTDAGTIQLGQASGTVAGQVTGPTNQPVVNAAVTITGGNNTQTAVTDGSGLYSASGFSAGPVSVAAIDPATSLRGQGLATLGSNSVTVNVKLSSLGTITGTVNNVAGIPVGAGVAVAISGVFGGTTVTDGLGHYTFPFVPLGHVTLDATDTTGHHGRTQALVSATNQVQTINVQYAAQGTVTGTVFNATGASVAGATVQLYNNGALSQQLTTTTNSLGSYTFLNVYAGTLNLSAIMSATQTGGSANAAVTTDGQTVTANITLQPTGTLTGTVFRADGKTVVPGAVITLQGTALTATADTNGIYTLSAVPLGTYSEDALDSSTGDRAEVKPVLSVAGSTVTQNLSLVGLGTLNVTVTDASGQVPIPSAQVSTAASSPYSQSQTGVTAQDGTVTLTQVLAGNPTVYATDPASGLTGHATVALAANATVAVTVMLQPAGTIQGTAFQSNATTPVGGVIVQLDPGVNGALRTAITASDGTYSFLKIPAGTHQVYAVDSLGNVLSSNQNVPITTQGQVQTVNLVLVGRGNVTGQVTNPDGTPASGIAVQVTSSLGQAQHPYGTQTDVNGLYTIYGVPVGGYLVIAQKLTLTSNSYGVGTGSIPADGATATTNIQLSTTLVPTTLNLIDADGETYPIRPTGALVDGAFSVFQGDGGSNEGGSLLSFVQNGTTYNFQGPQLSPVDQNGRQISITQNGIAGLNVTRRVYVPIDGYFARYLELINNPTAADITLDVQLTTNYRNVLIVTQQTDPVTGVYQTQEIDPAHIVTTSSGDNVLNIADPTNPDHWATFAGPTDDDPFLYFHAAGRPVIENGIQYNTNTVLPSVADVFDGPGAALSPSSAGFTNGSTGNYSSFVQTYGALRIPAGGTVGLLHFIGEENHYAAAAATAARLVQLPPEALAGLASTDLATIANFAVPAGGLSSVPALGSTTGGVSGNVYTQDGVTPVAGATVSLLNQDPIFDRTYQATSAADGSFAFQGALGGFAIPIANYSLSALHPQTAVISPAFPGTFSAGSVVSQQNVSFSNTGTIQGTVSRGPVVLNTAGTVTFSGGALTTIVSGSITAGYKTQLTFPIRADGTYSLSGVPPGTYTITAAVTNTLLVGITTATVTAGALTQADITIGTAGNLTGLVTRPDGSLATNDTVYLQIPGGNPLGALVDTSGRYSFTDVPTGTYTVNAYDTQTNAAASLSVTVVSATTVTQNLALQSTGTVTGIVTTNDGSSVSGLTVQLTSTAAGKTQTLSAATSATGSFSITGVTPGSLILRTTSPTGLQGTGIGALPLAGQNAVVNISLTAAGTVTGTVFQADGKTAAPGIAISISPAPLTGTATVTTDANGLFSFQNQPFGNFTLTAANAANGDFGSASGQIQANGQLRTINVNLNGFGNLTVMVTTASGSAVSSAAVTVSDGGGKTETGTTSASGMVSFPNIAAGAFTATAKDPTSGLGSQTTGSLAAGASQTVTIMLIASGTVQGTVYALDGVTPEASVVVQLNAPNGPSTTTAANGTYSFAQVSIGSYAASARDAAGYTRASATAQYLQTNGQILTENLIFNGIGKISGLVTNPDGTRAENYGLTLQSITASGTGNLSATTGGDGSFSFPEVPVGRFTINVNGLPSTLAGFAQGSVTADGTSQTVNIQIVNSTVTLPVTLTDGDGYPYPVQTSGAYLSTGTLLTPVTNTFLYAQGLNLTTSVGTGSFGDSTSPVTAISTLAGQGLELNMPSLAGLSVTRKIYVPANGYFARRLEVLQNTTSAPITATLVLTGGERDTTLQPRVVTTSNNNTTVDKTILWTVDDDDDGTTPYPQTEVALANVFEGQGTPAATLSNVSEVVNSTSVYRNNGYLSYQTQAWTYSYSQVTIPANSSVGFLFFTAQEASQSTATTAAQRLVQLPAEALAGLSAADLASVVNFVIPTAPLPAVSAPAATGALSGIVYAGDGATLIPNAIVYAQSTDLYFGSGEAAIADANGNYSIPTLLGPGYALEAVDPATTVTSAVTTGTYPASSPATQNISFTNTGILQGAILANGATTFASGTVYIGMPCAPTQTSNCINASRPVAADGSYKFLTVLAGTASLSATIVTQQGASYAIPSNGVLLQAVPAKQTTRFNFTLPATGSIAGTVTNAAGTAQANIKVSASAANNGSSGSTLTDANGHFVFSSILLDTYTVTATDPNTAGTVSKTVTITQDTTTTANLTFVGKGTVVATVKYANGGVGANTTVAISTSTHPAFVIEGTTDANGQFTFPNVPTGAFSIEAYYPGQQFFSTTTSSLTSDGQTLQLAVTLSPVGTVSGTLSNADGTPAPSTYVSIADLNGSAVGAYATNAMTDANGNYAIFPVPADRLVNLFSYPNTYTQGRTIEAKANNQKVPGDHQTLTVNLRFPGLATVNVTVLKADGTPQTSGTAVLKSSDGLQTYQASLSATTGMASFANVVEASFVAYAYTGATGYNLGSTLFQVKPTDDGNTVQVTIKTTPTGTVQGQVYASDGTTVLRDSYNVTLLDIDTGNSNYVYPSDSTGYSFTGVQVGASGYQLTAVSGNNSAAKATVTGNITTEGQTITQNLTLPVSAVSGTVFLFDGVTPVANASLYAQQLVNGNVNNTFYTSADGNGTYQLSGLVAGTYKLFAQDSNGVTATLNLILTSDTQILAGENLSLEATGTVTGTVYDANGNVSPNTQLQITSSADNGSFDISLNTDNNGNYTATDVAIGNITVTAFFSNTQNSATGALTGNGSTLTLNINAANTTSGHIYGTVYDTNGDPSQGANVLITPASQGAAPVSTTTNSNGIYAAGGLPLGQVTVSATLSTGTAVTAVTGNIPDTITAVEIDLGLSNPGQVNGIVSFANQSAAAGFNINIASSGDTSVSYGETTGNDGSFFFGNIAPGTITATVTDSKGKTLGTSTATLPYGGNLVINVTIPNGSTVLLTPPPLPHPARPSGHVAALHLPARRPGPPPAVSIQHPAQAASASRLLRPNRRPAALPYPVAAEVSAKPLNPVLTASQGGLR